MGQAAGKIDMQQPATMRLEQTYPLEGRDREVVLGWTLPQALARTPTQQLGHIPCGFDGS